MVDGGISELLLFACVNCRFVKFELPTVTTMQVRAERREGDPTCGICNCDLTPAMKYAYLFTCDTCAEAALVGSDIPTNDATDHPAEKTTPD